MGFVRTDGIMEIFAFERLIQILPNSLSQQLPGTSAHLTMAPAFRQNPDLLRIDGKPCRAAGVMALLFPDEQNTTRIILTKRREDLPEHAGQISFPGGRQEENETLIQTALRETEEEIGLQPEGIQVLGALSPIYIHVSNYCVHPFVGVLSTAPTTFEMQISEVQKVLEIPIPHLISPEARQSEIRTIRGQQLMVPFYSVEDEVIWGATAMILAELLNVIQNRTNAE